MPKRIKTSGQKLRPEIKALCEMLSGTEIKSLVAPSSTEEKYALILALYRSFTPHEATLEWRPRERWREIHPEENARQFLLREYLNRPFEERPYTHQLAHREMGDRPLYDALNMIIANNRRLGRSGKPGTLDGAQRLSDILPMLGGERGPKMATSFDPNPSDARAALRCIRRRISIFKSEKKRRIHISG